MSLANLLPAVEEAAWSHDDLRKIVGALAGSEPDLPRPYRTKTSLFLMANEATTPLVLMLRNVSVGE